MKALLDYLMSLSFVEIYALALAQSIIAMVFSWITIATRKWIFYIPTLLFALGNICLVCWYNLFR